MKFFNVMKIKSSLKVHLIFCILVVCIIFIFISCGNLDTNINCNECYYPEPDSADLIISFSSENYIQYIDILVFKGLVSAKDTIDSYFILNSSNPVDSKYYSFVRANNYYSVEAAYKLTDGRTIIVTDGNNLKTNFVSGNCSVDCWTIEAGDIDVRLNKDLIPDLK